MFFYHGRRADEEQTVKVDAVLCKWKFYSSVPKCANEYVKIGWLNPLPA
jgi:hypothetical protein